MKKGIILLMLGLLVLLTGVSCSSSKRMSVEDKRRGLLMLEGENIYKNKGFYKEKNSYARNKKSYNKKLKKNMRAYKKRNRR